MGIFPVRPTFYSLPPSHARRHFGSTAFCDAHSVRPSAAPGRGRGPGSRGVGASEAAGYAFVGFAGPQGAGVAARLLQEPVHLFKGAEIRLKVWRAQRQGPAASGGYYPGGSYREEGRGGWDAVGLTEPFDAAEAYRLASGLARAQLGGPASPASIWSEGVGYAALPRQAGGAPPFPQAQRGQAQQWAGAPPLAGAVTWGGP